MEEGIEETSSPFEKVECLGVVEKLSNRGYSFNKRFLCLSGGLLSYYSKVPPNAEEEGFTAGMLKALALKPKLAIEVKHIEAIRPADKSLCEKKKKNYMFVIEFKKSLLLNSKGEQKSKKVDEDIEQEWTFAVQKQEDYNKWVNILEQAKTIEILGPQLQKLEEPKILSKRRTSLTEKKTDQKSFPGVGQEYNRDFEINLRPSKLRKSRKVRIAEDGSSGEYDPNDEDLPSSGEDEVPEMPKHARVMPEEKLTVKDPKNVSLEKEIIREEEEQPTKTTKIGRKIDRSYTQEEESPIKISERKIDRSYTQEEEKEKKSVKRILSKNGREEKKKKSPVKELEKIDWEYHLNKLMEDAFSRSVTMESLVDTEFEIAKLVGEFRTKAVDLCKTIINEFNMPSSKWTHKAREDLPFQGKKGVFERTFYTEDMVVKLTWSKRELVDTPDIRKVNVFIEKTFKAYNHEFRAMNVLNDFLHLFNKRGRNVTYRVPLAVIVDYSGFRCLVTSNIRVNGEESLHLGPMESNGGYRANTMIEEDLKTIASFLNLKEHNFILGDKITSVKVPLSVFTEVHKMPLTPNYSSNNQKLKPLALNQNSFSSHQNKNFECYYLMKIGDIFPIDIDIDIETDNERSASFLKRLRPEFVLAYETPLSADALLDTVEHVNNEDDDIEVAQASIYLRSTVIPEFVRKLEALEIILSDSAVLTHAFHCHGINMRYLGLVANEANLPHIKEACRTEMIARVAKKFLRKQLSELVLNKFHEEEHLEKHVLYERKKTALIEQIDIFSLVTGQESNSEKPSELYESDQAVIQCVLKFLNLVFGDSQNSEIFWRDVLSKQIVYDYNFNINHAQKGEVRLGGLLHAIIYQCGLELKFDASIEEKLGQSSNPFTKEHFQSLQVRSKIFSMKGLGIKSLSEKYMQARMTQEYEAAIKSCLVALKLNKEISYRHESINDPILLGDMAEILFESGDLDKAFMQAQEGMKCSRLLHSEALKSLCIMMRIHMMRDDYQEAVKIFETAVSYLNFHFGMYHPLHVTLYNIQGYYLAEKGSFKDALILYESSLECCNRVLGGTHPLTGEVYLDLGNLTVKMQLKEDALAYFEKAYYASAAHRGENSKECAAASYMMASLLISFGKMREVMEPLLRAIEIYENQPGSFSAELADCYLLMCDIGDLKDEPKLSFDHACKAWPLLSKLPAQKNLEYKSRLLKRNLASIIKSLTSEKRSAIQITFEILVETWKDERVLDKLNDPNKKVLIEQEYLKDLFQMCNTNKNVENLLKHIFKIISQRLNGVNSKAFFANYRENVEKLEDSQLKECLLNFEKLVFIQGIESFEALLKKAF